MVALFVCFFADCNISTSLNWPMENTGIVDSWATAGKKLKHCTKEMKPSSLIVYCLKTLYNTGFMIPLVFTFVGKLEGPKCKKFSMGCLFTMRQSAYTFN